MADRLKDSVKSITLIFISLIIFLSLISYSPSDIPFLTTSPNLIVENYIDVIGSYLSFVLFFIFGHASFIIPTLLLSWGVGKILGISFQKFFLKIIASITLLLSSSSILSLPSVQSLLADRFRMGGLTGVLFSDFLIEYFGKLGTVLILLFLFILSILLVSEFLIIPFLIKTTKIGFKSIKVCAEKFLKLIKFLLTLKLRKADKISKSSTQMTHAIPSPYKSSVSVKEQREIKPEQTKVMISKPGLDFKKQVSSHHAKKIHDEKRRGSKLKMPPLDLLNLSPSVNKRQIKEDLQRNSDILEDTLRDFGIEAKVVNVDRGPVVTRYELRLAAGIKVHRITSLSDDMALVMKAHSVRIVAPMPGKGTIGVEVPNTITTLVYIRDVLESREFQTSTLKLTLGLGKDISGVPLISDLSQMPHLLIAGTTGSGKTACINGLICSMLYQSTSDEVKFLMIDPKMVELSCFNGLSHLLCPVVTQPKKVAASLKWVVEEMEKRYNLFAKCGVKNIEIYNRKFKNNELFLNENLKYLPYIVIIVDELADLMSVVAEEIEDAIVRLAQLSRAVGIHMILATQRPSVNVITGVIKANFPARISFKVASKVDSRTVLDMNGADKLLGKGDMLFLKPGSSKLIRAQGSLVSDEEIERVVKYIKAQKEPEYEGKILEKQEAKITHRGWKRDELYDEAVKVVTETKQASVSMLQRRLRLGYTRAARLVDMMEEEGVVGPYRGSKPRVIIKENK